MNKWLGIILLIILATFSSYALGLRREIKDEKTPQKIERIISLYSAATQILYDLGMAEKIVGVNRSSSNPPGAEKKVQLGRGFGHINIEMVMALEPDIVFAWRPDGKVLKEKGIPVFVRDSDTCNIKRVIGLIRDIGKVVGKEVRAEEIAHYIQERLEKIKKKTAYIQSKPLVYFESGSLGHTRGPGSLTYDLITLAGGENLAKDEKVPFPLLSNEYIITQNPDIIIVEEYGASTERRIEKIKGRDGWQEIKAIKNNRIFRSPVYYTDYAPRCIEGLEQFARWFHPELFEE